MKAILCALGCGVSLSFREHAHAGVPATLASLAGIAFLCRPRPEAESGIGLAITTPV